MWWILWMLLGIGAVVGLILWIVLAERKRRKLVAQWAAAKGWQPFDAARECGWLSNFEAWGPGYGHRNYDGYEGTVGGHTARVWQHQSRTKTKDGENIHNFTICAMEMPVQAPNLRFKREGWGHKLVDALGGEDIDFESDEFSRRFWVKCDNRRFAYDVIHPRMMDFLLTAPKAKWQWRGTQLVLFVGGGLRPKRAQPLIANATAFLDLLPAHLEASSS